jgi:hypothetical protein
MKIGLFKEVCLLWKLNFASWLGDQSRGLLRAMPQAGRLDQGLLFLGEISLTRNAATRCS